MLMRDVMTVMRKIFLYYPINYTIVVLIRIGGFAGLGVLSGLLIERFFDEVSESTLTFNKLYLLTALLVVVPLVQALTYSIDLALSYGWVEIIRSIFRRNLFRAILNNPGASSLPVSHGQLMNVLREDVKMPEAWMWDFPYLLAYMLFSIAGFVILSSIDWIVTLVLFAPLILAMTVIHLLRRKITIYYEQQQRTTDRVLSLLSDLFNYNQAIKIHRAESAFLSRLNKLNEDRAAASKRNAVFQASLESVYENLIQVGIAILLLLISEKIRDGSFGVGQFTLFVYFLGYVSGMTRLFGNAVTGFKKSAVSLARIGEVLGGRSIEKLTLNNPPFLAEARVTQAPPTPPNPSGMSTNRLENLDVRGLSFTYPGTDVGIRDVSFSIPRGSFTVVTGKIGAGKTTLLRVLLGLLPSDSGEMMWNGSRIREASQFFMIPPRVAYTSQTPYLFSDTLLRNILLGCSDESRVQQAVHLAALETDLILLGEGLQTELGPKGVNLSGGQQQRVAVSRMLARNAELLVLDDISSALDPETEARMWGRLNEYRKANRIACLVVTQKPYAMRIADQILVLDHGQLRLFGARDEVLPKINKE